MSSIKLQHLHDPKPDQLGHSLYEFLCGLGGPTVIHLSGKDTSRCRVVLTLLHGNEPSGFKAIYRLINEGYRPQVNTKFIIASVLAARTEPIFTHRMLPSQRDLNRCFSDSNKDLQSELANAIYSEICSYNAEAIIDLHNTSGSGPAFSVAIHNTDKHLSLASHFTHRMIVTDLRLGSIMEQDFDGPIITVEAGGSQDDEADLTAYYGIQSFLNAEDVFLLKQDVEQLCNPRRLELRPHASIAYSEVPRNDVDISMYQFIEKLNFGVTHEGQAIGWCKHDTLDALRLDSDGTEVSDFFKVENHQLLTHKALTMFMVTTRADIAKSDCLFYFIDTST